MDITKIALSFFHGTNYFTAVTAKIIPFLIKSKKQPWNIKTSDLLLKMKIKTEL